MSSWFKKLAFLLADRIELVVVVDFWVLLFCSSSRSPVISSKFESSFLRP